MMVFVSAATVEAIVAEDELRSFLEESPLVVVLTPVAVEHQARPTAAALEEVRCSVRQASSHAERVERIGEALVVRRLRLSLDGPGEVRPEILPAEALPLQQRKADPEYPTLPRRLEHQLAVRSGRRVEAVERDAHRTDHSRATPIIESRVTSAASWSSSRSSVPAGRRGSTR